VNYSLSAGVIMATGSASRRPLCVSGVLMLAPACSPLFIGFLASVPTVVTGCLLLYVLASQFAAALTLAPESGAVFDYSRGLVIGLPLLLGTMVAFLPAEAAASLPAAARPLLTNGFVVGFAAVILLEHVIMRRSREQKHS
jgi:xanthine/uracil permease